jgi:hypothetical protein
VRAFFLPAELVAAELVAAELVAAELVAAELVAAELVAAELVAAELVAAELVPGPRRRALGAWRVERVSFLPGPGARAGVCDSRAVYVILGPCM